MPVNIRDMVKELEVLASQQQPIEQRIGQLENSQELNGISEKLKELEDELGGLRTNLDNLKTRMTFISGQIPGYSAELLDDEDEPKDEPYVYGKASSYSNNCSFHCLAEILFRLSDDKLEIVSEFDGFKYICAAFSEYYGINSVDLQLIKRLNGNLFSASKNNCPYDFQMVWGPVLRRAFYRYLNSALDESEKLAHLPAYQDQDGNWDYSALVEIGKFTQFVATLGGYVRQYDCPEGQEQTLKVKGGFPKPCWNMVLKLERHKNLENNRGVSEVEQYDFSELGQHGFSELDPYGEYEVSQFGYQAFYEPSYHEISEPNHQEFSALGHYEFRVPKETFREQLDRDNTLEKDKARNILIPKDHCTSGLDQLSQIKCKGKDGKPLRFHEIENFGPINLQAELLRIFVKSQLSVKPVEYWKLSNAELDALVNETSNETSTGYSENSEKQQKSSIFTPIVNFFQALSYVIASPFRWLLGWLFIKNKSAESKSEGRAPLNLPEDLVNQRDMKPALTRSKSLTFLCDAELNPKPFQRSRSDSNLALSAESEKGLKLSDTPKL